MSARHEQLAGWGGIPGECGVECACGTTFDGFSTLAEAKEQLDHHIAHAEFVAGLRELADWYQAHPEVPIGFKPTYRHVVLANDDASGSAEIQVFADALVVEVTRTPYAGHYHANGKFAGLAFEAYYVPREESRQYAADRELLAAAKAAQISAEIDPAVRERAEYTAGLRTLAAALDTIAPTARTGAAIPPTPVDPGSLKSGTGPGHQDAGDGQGARPAGVGGEDDFRPMEGPSLAAIHRQWLDRGLPSDTWLAWLRQYGERQGVGSPPAPATTRGHPCIDVPPGVRVLGDPDYGQTSRSS